MPRNSPYSVMQQIQIACYAADCGVAAAMAQWSLSRSTVRRYARLHGIKLPRGPRPQREAVAS